MSIQKKVPIETHRKKSEVAKVFHTSILYPFPLYPSTIFIDQPQPVVYNTYHCFQLPENMFIYFYLMHELSLFHCIQSIKENTIFTKHTCKEILLDH